MNSRIEQKILESKEIINKAIIDHKPYAKVAMFSGGTDSLGFLTLLQYLGVKVDFVMHGVTGTGLPQTREFVRSYCEKYPAKYIEADAGNEYEKYVLRKGFFGRGKDAHAYAYHVLKSGPFEKALSKNIVQGVKGRKILLFNGVRDDESNNRQSKYDGEVINIYKRKPNNIWVNVVFWWSKEDLKEFLDGLSVETSPVHKALGRSGECNCGTMQSQADRIAASEFCPAWGKWIDDLEKKVIQNGFPWRWGQTINQYHKMEMKGQTRLFDHDEMPMCVGCKARATNFNDGEAV